MYDIIHTTSFVAVVIASLFGSLHCLGMCGGIVVLSGSQKSSPIVGQLYYHLGRGVAYVGLGAVVGYYGDRGLRYAAQRTEASYIVVAIVGVLLFLLAMKVRQQRAVAASLSSIASKGAPYSMARLYRWAAQVPFFLGVATIFLPCGWFYSFVVLAATAGGTLPAAKLMLAFWLGTLPVLLLAGTVFEKSLRRVAQKYPLLPLLLVTFVGVVSLSMHLVTTKNTSETNMIEDDFPERCIH